MVHKYKLGFYHKIGITFNSYLHSNTGKARIEIKPSILTFQKWKLKLKLGWRKEIKCIPIYLEIPPLCLSKIPVPESYSNATSSIVYCLWITQWHFHFSLSDYLFWCHPYNKVLLYAQDTARESTAVCTASQEFLEMANHYQELLISLQILQ